MAKVVVTGASGFIGRRLTRRLRENGHDVVEAGRRLGRSGNAFVDVGNVGPDTDWGRALADAAAVVHLAGPAHAPKTGDAAFFAVNDAGAARLADACAASGIGRLVAVSSIAARTAEREGAGATPYGRSKLAGEEHVLRFGQGGGGRSGVVLRPPLVYGVEAPGNWHRLQKLAASRLPLPFGAIANRRSLCSVDNLCDAILAAVEAGPQTDAQGIYEIADREIVSLAEIVTALRAGMGRPAKLVPIPSSLLRFLSGIAGRGEMAAALLDDMVLDPGPFISAFGWTPPVTTSEGIAQSGREFASSRG